MAKWDWVKQSDHSSFSSIGKEESIKELGIKNNSDKFYTKEEIAKKCYNFAKRYIPEVGTLIEPSAGNGSFLKVFDSSYDIIALDIFPEEENIIQQDFLSWNKEFSDVNIFIGNPPFGKKMKAGIEFFNHAAEIGDYICFIFPVSAMKWSVQKKFNSDFKLLDYFYLPENSFYDEGREYSIRTVFQVWSRKGTKDLRLKKAPPIEHKDFALWQYNATPESLKVLEEDWEYALYRQGRYDFNQIFTRKDYLKIQEEMTRKKKKRQFFFVKPLNEQARENFLKMDFNNLAARNAVTPGFGKADFVSYYKELFEKQSGGIYVEV